LDEGAGAYGGCPRQCRYAARADHGAVRVKRRGLGTTKTALYFGTLLFGLMVLLTVVMVVAQLVKGESVREPLEAVWLSWGGMPLIFAVGLPVLLLVGAVTAFEESREADDEDVLLTIDDTGIHLGGEQPRTIPWPEVRGVCRIERHDVNAEGGESWHPYLVVLLHDDDSLPRNSKLWARRAPGPAPSKSSAANSRTPTSPPPSPATPPTSR
jgi:hypothetical protein